MKKEERCQIIKDILKDVETNECKINNKRCETVKQITEDVIEKECMLIPDNSNRYMYRGTSLSEAQNVIKGEASGGFWSNYYDISYVHGALLVAKNKEPKLKWKGEMPGTYHLHLKDIVSIYVDNDSINIRFPLGLVQVYPLLTETEFKKLCTTPTSRKLSSRLYAEYLNAVDKYRLCTEEAELLRTLTRDS